MPVGSPFRGRSATEPIYVRGHLTDAVANLFVHRSAAQRYAVARPYFHPLVIEKLLAFTGKRRFDHALDVACGTGQSSHALADVADVVNAIDSSADMLTECIPHPQIHFQVAPAERLPFSEDAFDLVTVGLAFHWFDQQTFLSEASRTLKPGGWLVIYNSGFKGEMVKEAAFRQWAWETYPAQFPTPPRHPVQINDALVKPHGFALVGKEGFDHEERWGVEQLTTYLLTQTNVIAKVEQGKMTLLEAAAWVHAGVKPFFRGQVRTMKFGGSIWFLQRLAAR